MSRTRRRDPGGCWMRSPRRMRAAQQIEQADAGYADEGIAAHRNRKPIPPDAWEEIRVSYWRGQPWARNR